MREGIGGGGGIMMDMNAMYILNNPYDGGELKWMDMNAILGNILREI